MYNCPKCNEPFDIGTKFCSKCGCNLEKAFIEHPVCPVCHKSYPAGSAFCTADGTKLVSPDKLIPKCVICGTQYSADTKFCPKDGGAVIPEALRYTHRASVQTNTTYPQKADLGNRFVALLLDGLICVGLSIPAIVFYTIGMASVSTSYYGTTDYSNSIPSFFLAFFAYFIPLIYAFVKDGMGEGQSWGKKAMKLKVINIADSSNCSKGTSSLRNLIGSFLGCIPIIGWLIEPIMVLTTADGRRLADKVAGTMVVNV